MSARSVKKAPVAAASERAQGSYIAPNRADAISSPTRGEYSTA